MDSGFNGSRALRASTGARSLQRRVSSLLFGLILLAASASLGAQMPTQKIIGQIVKLDGLELEVRTTGGTLLAIRLSEHVRLSARSPADAAALTTGAFVGTTAVAQADGALLAREVHVFPESMRGTGEGHRPMDTEAGSTMTNATVATVAAQGNNARVEGVSAGPRGVRLTLRYKGGEKIVVVPDDVAIVMVEPADRSLLVPGAHVVVFAAAQPDGTLVAERLTVGKNGFAPPS